MSSNWFALYAQLVRSVNRHSSISEFSRLHSHSDRLRRFRDPARLISWLHDPGEPAEAKNDVLHHLLRAVSKDDDVGGLAVEILILALWPGLSVIRQRLRRRWRCDVGGLDGDLVGQLSIAIRSADPNRVRRVAATLLRNVERDLGRRLVRASQVSASETDIDVHAPFLAADTVTDDADLLHRISKDLGPDGVLLAAVHIFGWSQKEAADQLGIGHEASRKRCQRAIARLRRSAGR